MLEGQRDHALLSILYNTGARIQEALNVCPQTVRFDSPACVRLYSKGRKGRLSPLWPEPVSLLKALIQRQPRADEEPIFVNRYGPPLGAPGLRFRLAEYVQAAAKFVPRLTSKHVTPHSFRHYLPCLTMSSDIGQRSAEADKIESQRGRSERTTRHSLVHPTGC
jgi:integrase